MATCALAIIIRIIPLTFLLQDIAVDSSGHAYVTGYTDSDSFPTLAAFDDSFNGGSYDAFVSKFAPSGPLGTTLVYSTFLGGDGEDRGQVRALSVHSNRL